VEYADLDSLSGEVLAALDAVEAVRPAELRERVVERLAGLAGVTA
jgi:predicted DNA-binding transcriptional regulator YafY